MVKNLWEIKQSAENPSSIDLYIYSAVEGDSYDWWSGSVKKSETSAQYFRETLEKYKNVDNINLYINSLGGSVLEGVSIYNQLRRHPAKVTAYIDGFACSVASVIAMAADKVIMPKNAVMMIHNAWAVASGNAKELRKAADDLDVLNEAGRNAYLLKSAGKIAEEELVKLMDAETYLTAEQCMEYGFADEYAEKDISIETAKNALQSAREQGITMYTSRLEQICQLADSITDRNTGDNGTDDLPAQFMKYFK